MPYHESHFAIAVNRQLVQLDTSYDNDFFISAFRPEIWAAFLALSFVCILLNLKLRKVGRFQYHLP